MFGYQLQPFISRRRRDQKDHIEVVRAQLRFKLARLFRCQISHEHTVNTCILRGFRQSFQTELKQRIVVTEENDRRIDVVSRACRRVEDLLQSKVVFERSLRSTLNHWSISHRIAERHTQLNQRRIRRDSDEELFGGGEVWIAGGDVGNKSLLSVSLQSCEGVSDASQRLRLQCFAHGIYIFVSASGKVHYEYLIAAHLARRFHCVRDGVRGLERGNDAFEFRKKSKCFERIAI